jgi:antitoxin component HigA of HigAB toxin-antitoxin module
LQSWHDEDLRAAFQTREKLFLAQEGLTPKDLERYAGSSGRVSKILNRKRRLSLQMIKRWHAIAPTDSRKK